jgi:membrane protein DedA with SNARE-associated domain
MSSLLDRFVEWGQQLVDAIGYLGLAIIMFLENVFPPIPSEPFLLGAGFTSGRGGMSMAGAIAAATLGAAAGATLYYYIGVILPEPRIRALLRRYGKWALLEEEDLDRALSWFRDHGQAVIFFGRCIPIVRTLISVPAGLTRMPLPRFLLFTALGTGVWSALLIVIGRLLGENWEAALTFFDRYEQVFYAAIAISVVAFVVVRLRSRRRRRDADAPVRDSSPSGDRPS